MYLTTSRKALTYIRYQDKHDRMNLFTRILGLFCTLNFVFAEASRVLELSDRFLDVYKDGSWFVMFYAPWCGHCKKLEPIWAQVAQSLYPPVIRVAQVDSTRFPNVASQFKVKGFPTVLFMKNGEIFQYKGERTRELIVDYAERMALPPIQHLYDAPTLKEKISGAHKFFLFVGDQEGSLWEAFNATAHEFQPHIYFYSTSLAVVQESGITSISTEPNVLVFKDNTHYVYQSNGNTPLALETRSESEDAHELPAIPGLVDLRDWINHERFPSVVEISAGNFHQVLRVRKYIVLAVLEIDKVGRMPKAQQEYRDVLEKFAHDNHDRFHEKFLFGWTGSPDLANSVAMETLPVPCLIVINATNYAHHLPEQHIEVLSPDKLEEFLTMIQRNEVQELGGLGLLARLMRMYYEATTTLTGMWYGNPVLTSVIIGLPMGFLSLICYSMWCADIMDASEDEPAVREKED